MTTRHGRAGALAFLLGTTLLAGQAHASDATTVKLIELLVKNGVLKRDQANALLHEAQSEAGTATTHHRRVRTEIVSTTPPGEAGAGGNGAAGNGEQTAAGTAPSETPVHVTYVPPMVRDEIAAEVKQEVMQEAQDESWAGQNGAASWTQRIVVSGDLRIRGERVLFPGELPLTSSGTYDESGSGNYPDFTDFNAINNSTNGYDTNRNTNTALPPLLNTTEDRTLVRLRARINVAAQVSDAVDADIRVATGNDDSPVSENQTLGANGAFDKYEIWLDAAYLRWRPSDWLTVLAGRSYNPFWTSNLLFYDDLRFDGFAVQLHHPITAGVNGFVNAGGFPLFNTSFDFGSDGDSDVKYGSHDEWLLAIQGGAEWKISPHYAAKFAAGFFDFLGVQGAESTPCLDPTVDGDCSTDDTRDTGDESFGNTLFPIRNIETNPADAAGETPNPELYGLASKFEVLDLHGEFKVLTWSPIDVTLMGDFVDNLGFNRSAIVDNDRFANNYAAGSDTAYAGGSTAYDVALSVGHADLGKLWNWSASVAYKYISTDALLDSLTDPNFHLGGTNAKGYIVNANLGLARSTYLAATWYSAAQVSGAPYANDVLFVDLNAAF